jgi:uncharacterized protein
MRMYVVELAFGPEQERLAARPAHRERLGELHKAGSLVMAGPWEDDTGALLVFDTDKAGMDEIVAADPYYRTPGVSVRSVRKWSPIVGA